jgi:hypothetical protein
VLRLLGDRALLAEGLLRQVELLIAVGEPGTAPPLAAEAAEIFASLGRSVDEAKARALALRARAGRPTLLKGLVVLLLVVAPAAAGVALGLWKPWLWIAGVPLVLLSLFMLASTVSPRLRGAVERMARRM